MRCCAALAGTGLVGMLLGLAAWGEGRAPLLALLLPVALAVCPSRAQAFCLALGYTGATLRFNRAFMANWFGGDLWPSLGWLVLVLFAALVWMLAWTAAPAPWRRAGHCLAAWLLAGLPPAALLIAGHPLVGAGYLLPGWGWWGVALAALAAPCAVYGMAWRQWSVCRQWQATAAMGLLLAAASPLLTVPVATQLRGIAAIDTSWGRLGGEEALLARMAAMGHIQAGASAQTTAIVWPESILGRAAPALEPVMTLEVLRPAARAGRTTVVGLDLPAGPARLQSAAVAFYPDGSNALARARQPVPGALWRPWTDGPSFAADWTADALLPLGQGDTAAVFFCYEELTPWLFLLTELRQTPTMYLALANTWADATGGADRLQAKHSQGMSLLFGRNYLRSTNRGGSVFPAPSTRD